MDLRHGLRDEERGLSLDIRGLRASGMFIVLESAIAERHLLYGAVMPRTVPFIDARCDNSQAAEK